MTIGRDTFWPQTDIADGTRLDGCWTLLDYRSFGEGTSVSGGVGYTRSLTLRPDGTFASAGLGFASATFENSAGQYDGGFSSGSRTGKTAGKYEFRDGVLILRADDGSEVRHNAFPLSPRVLLIDGVAHIDGSKPEK